MGVRLFKKFLLALVDTASKNLDQTTLAQITPYTSDREWQNAHGTGHGTKTKKSPEPSFHESRTAHQIAWMISQYVRIGDTDEASLDFNEILEDV